VTAEGFRSRTAGTEQLVMVVGGALVGYISVARAQTRAQLTAILVDPACRRAGLGSELLAEARRNLGGGVKSWSAGSGAGPDFWPGVPENARDGWAFLLQERHFPNWTAFFEHQLSLPGTVLVARADGQIVGTCTVEGPAEYDFLWRGLIRGAVGAFGCVGVDPAARSRGIGLAMVARACELLSARGAEVCYCAYTYLEDWYAQLGFTCWRRYTMASA
jgi:ribosomal protein S18 acetylase RimI-like enzyme